MAVVVVDLDGTLLDTRARHHAAYAAALSPSGSVPLGPGAFWRAKRRAAPWSRILETGVSQDVFLQRFKDLIERPDLLALDLLQPGAARALARLRGAGRELLLVTARCDAQALAGQLRDLGVAGIFADVIATAGTPKHAPLATVGPIERWIGDTEEDVVAAHAIGALVTGVTNGIRTPSRLRRAGADDLAPSFAMAVERLLVGYRS